MRKNLGQLTTALAEQYLFIRERRLVGGRRRCHTAYVQRSNLVGSVFLALASVTEL
jgi:hypothetical protein